MFADLGRFFRLKIIFSKILLGFVIFAGFAIFFRLKIIVSKVLLGFLFERYLLRSLCDHLFPRNPACGPPHHLVRYMFNTSPPRKKKNTHTHK